MNVRILLPVIMATLLLLMGSVADLATDEFTNQLVAHLTGSISVVTLCSLRPGRREVKVRGENLITRSFAVSV